MTARLSIVSMMSTIDMIATVLIAPARQNAGSSNRIEKPPFRENLTHISRASFDVDQGGGAPPSRHLRDQIGRSASTHVRSLAHGACKHGAQDLARLTRRQACRTLAP